MKEKLKEKLLEYFDINRDCDYYILTRDKSAFNYGTMSFDDFKEFDEEIIDDIVSYVFKEESKEVTVNTEVERCIKSIGFDLVDRAKDISNDLKRVSTIDINAKICAGEIINYDIIKNYTVLDCIHYEKIEKNSEKSIDQ